MYTYIMIINSIYLFNTLFSLKFCLNFSIVITSPTNNLLLHAINTGYLIAVPKKIITQKNHISGPLG